MAGEVAQCLAQNTANYCSYFYDDAMVTAFQVRCYCGTDGALGYCPVPLPKFMANFTYNDNQVLSNSANCHTLDRDNVRAQAECGIGPSKILNDFAD